MGGHVFDSGFHQRSAVARSMTKFYGAIYFDVRTRERTPGDGFIWAIRHNFGIPANLGSHGTTGNKAVGAISGFGYGFKVAHE